MPHSNNFNTTSQKPVVLLSPLDWGLGHTTRCIPIINELLHRGCDVIIACNSTQKALLQQEFPQLTYVHLAGYNLKYGKGRWGTIVRIILQTPKILIKINNENNWLNIFLQSQKVNLIISDNRFGLHAPGIPSIFITHQLYIKTGIGNFIDRMLQKINYRRIQRFTRCWVPDYKGMAALAGLLSNPAVLPALPIHYLGCLSRFYPCKQATNTINVLIILSGPEPQRSIFETLILNAQEHLPNKTVLVRGLPGETTAIATAPKLSVYNHAPVHLLNELICNAELVISRSGYTTVMDLLKLGKKSILVPTPGQAEQEYVAAHLHRQQLAYTVQQHQFSLGAALTNARSFAYKKVNYSMVEYKTVVGEMVAALKTGV